VNQDLPPLESPQEGNKQRLSNEDLLSESKYEKVIFREFEKVSS
jgi:hypothetical protein